MSLVCRFPVCNGGVYSVLLLFVVVIRLCDPGHSGILSDGEGAFDHSDCKSGMEKQDENDEEPG